MLAADVVVAEEGTRFSQLEVKRGLMAFGGATIRFVERAGWGNAQRWLLTGDEFDTGTALRLGFVQEVVAKGEGLARAVALAESIARQAPLAVRASRENSAIAVRRGPEAAERAFGAATRGYCPERGFRRRCASPSSSGAKALFKGPVGAAVMSEDLGDIQAAARYGRPSTRGR